jgi:hypothetical protein
MEETNEDIFMNITYRIICVVHPCLCLCTRRFWQLQSALIAAYNFKITSLYAGRPSCCQSATNATPHNQHLTHPQCYSSTPIPTAQRRQNGAVMTSERRHRRIARAGTENGQQHREVICSSFLIFVIYIQTSETERFMWLSRAWIQTNKRGRYSYNTIWWLG